MATFKGLLVWQKTMDLARLVYGTTANDLETQIILSRDFGFIDEVAFQELTRLNDEVSKMLSSLIYTLKHRRESEIL